MTNTSTVIRNRSDPQTSTPSRKAVLASCLLRAPPSTSNVAAVASEGTNSLRPAVAAGVAAPETVLVEGKLLRGKVEANGSRVLRIGCGVALGEDCEGVLLFVVVAERPVVRAGVVFATAVVVVITEVAAVVRVSYGGFAVVRCGSAAASALEAVVVRLLEVTCAVLWFTFSAGFAVVAFNVAAPVLAAVPAGGAEPVLEGMKAAG